MNTFLSFPFSLPEVAERLKLLLRGSRICCSTGWWRFMSNVAFPVFSTAEFHAELIEGSRNVMGCFLLSDN